MARPSVHTRPLRDDDADTLARIFAPMVWHEVWHEGLRPEDNSPQLSAEMVQRALGNNESGLWEWLADVAELNIGDLQRRPGTLPWQILYAVISQDGWPQVRDKAGDRIAAYCRRWGEEKLASVTAGSETHN